jgi:hypothetical protein
MKPIALAVLVVATSFAAGAAPRASAEEGLPAVGPTSEAVVFEVRRTLRPGDAVRLDLDPARAVVSVEALWDDREDGARAKFVFDGVVVAKRYVGEGEREVVEVGRRGKELVVKMERGRGKVDRVLVRYEPAVVLAPAPDRVLDPIEVVWSGPQARRLAFHAEFKSGERLRIPAGFSGMRVREVRVTARALDFRARIELTGGGVRPTTLVVGREETLVFPAEGLPDDTQDLTLVMALRRAHVGEVVVVYDAPVLKIEPQAGGGVTVTGPAAPAPAPSPAAGTSSR